MAIRVVLVDDHKIMREGMCVLLDKCGDIEVVGQAAEGQAALVLVNELHPDVVIMDVGMPNLNGIDATRQMIECHPTLKVMALSAHSEGSLVAKMIKAGARGYMHKDSAFSELKEGILTILSGRTFLCSRISKLVFSDYITMIADSTLNGSDALSPREREVLQLVAEGHTTKVIAQELNLSPKTVDSHREHIMEKLGIRSIAGLTRYALRVGLTTQ